MTGNQAAMTRSWAIGVVSKLGVGAATLILSAGLTGIVGISTAAATTGPPSQLVFTTEPPTYPTTVTAGTGTFNLVVSVEDSSGNVVTGGSADSVTVAFNNPFPSTAVLHCTGGTTQPVDTATGQASFACSTNTAGEFNIEATDTANLSPGYSTYVDVVAGPASQLAFSTQPENASTNVGFPVIVSVEDSFGNQVNTDSTDHVALAITPGTGTTGAALNCSPANSMTASFGSANFQCALDTTGLGYTLTATNPGGTLTKATSAAFNIGQESAIISLSPIPAIIVNNATADFTVTVTVTNAASQPVSGDEIKLVSSTLDTGGGSISPSNPAPTNSSGTVTFAVSCYVPYCGQGQSVIFGVLNTTTNTALANPAESFASLGFPTEGSVGQPQTFSLNGAAPNAAVSVGFAPDANSTPVAAILSGTCTTDSNGYLASGACNFTVPSVPGVTLPVDVTATVSVGPGTTVQIRYFLEQTPAIQLSPTTGEAGTVITVNGGGFGYSATQTVTFTPVGATTPTTTASCQNDGNGNIVNNAYGTCTLTVPAGTPAGAATVEVSGYPTAAATFTVTVPTLTGIELDTSGLPTDPSGGYDLYVGSSGGLGSIYGLYSDGTRSLLTIPPGGPYPQATLTTQPTPAGAITLTQSPDGSYTLAAVTVTTSPAVMQVTYEGFSTSITLNAVQKPVCGVPGTPKCVFVNGALLTVQAEIPGPLVTSTPVSGAVITITQPPGQIVSGPCGPGSYTNIGCNPISTLSGATTLSNSTCTTGQNGSVTSGPGACQVTDGVGAPDVITITPPADYIVTGVSWSAGSCGTVTPAPAVPACIIDPSDFNPETVTFTLEPYPTLQVNISGPTDSGFNSYNQMADGQLATILPINGTPGSPQTCTTGFGNDSGPGIFAQGGSLTGTAAHCTVQLPPGQYQVSVPTQWSAADPYYNSDSTVSVYTSGANTNSQEVTLTAGADASPGFSTSFTPDLTVDISGPSCFGVDCVENDWANGVPVTVQQVDSSGNPIGSPSTCSTSGGAYLDPINGQFGGDASCGVQVGVGTYQVSIPSQWMVGIEPVYVSSADSWVQKVTLNPGDSPTLSFSTSDNLENVGSGLGAATTTDGLISATGSAGSGTVTVGEYSSDPVGAPSFSSSGQYFDVFLSAGNSFTGLTFTDCNLNGGTSIYWWNAAASGGAQAWQPVSDETAPSGSPPCITVTITNSTSPDIAQMTGTVFGVAAQIPQSISFNAPPIGVYGGSASMTGTGGGSRNPVTFTVDASSGKGVCSLTGSTVSYTGVGNCVIDANQAGNIDYSAAPQVSQTIVVAPALLTVTADNQSRLYGEPNPPLTYEVSGFVRGDTLSSAVTGTADCTTSASPASDVGPYPITCTLGTLSAGNYIFAFEGGTLTVNPATTSTGLSASADPADPSAPVTYTAAITPAATSGRVVFEDAGTPIAVCGGSSGMPVIDGTATCTVTYSQTGTHSITAAFSAPPDYLPSTSEGLGETIARCGTSLAGCNLMNGDLQNADLAGANLSGANLKDANLAGANLIGADLSGANLMGANLAGAELDGADMSGANLKSDNFTGASAVDTSFSGANLMGANLTGADLAGGNLTAANLMGSNLTGADLDSAIVTAADLKNITWSNTTCPDATNSNQDGGTCVGT